MDSQEPFQNLYTRSLSLSNEQDSFDKLELVGTLPVDVSILYSYFLKKRNEWRTVENNKWVGLGGGIENGRVNPAKIVRVFGTEDEVRVKLKKSGAFPILVQPLYDHVYSI